jgi:hypothetical protein
MSANQCSPLPVHDQQPSTVPAPRCPPGPGRDHTGPRSRVRPSPVRSVGCTRRSLVLRPDRADRPNPVGVVGAGLLRAVGNRRTGLLQSLGQLRTRHGFGRRLLAPPRRLPSRLHRPFSAGRSWLLSPEQLPSPGEPGLLVGLLLAWSCVRQLRGRSQWPLHPGIRRA